MNVKSILDKLMANASSTLDKPQKTLNLLDKVREKYSAVSLPKLTDLKSEMEVAMAMVKDYAKGTYRKVPWQSMLSIVGAFIYFLNPFDLVPDFIPLKGFLDDATVLVYVLHSLKEDLEQYEEWKKGEGDDSP